MPLLTDRGEQTEVVIPQTCATAQERDDAEQGSGYLLAGLAAHAPAS